MRKYIVLATLVTYLIWTFGGLYSPLISNSSAAPWTREKAAHLARATLFYADPQIVDRLYAAGSAGAAVDILFPSVA